MFRRTVVIKAVTTATIVLLLFAVTGEFLLDIFHVSLPALKIAGGLIVVLFAFHMMMGEEKPESSDQVPLNPSTNVTVYPIAMPMLATPQWIVVIVTIMAGAVTFYDVTKVIVLLLISTAIDLAVLLAADRIIRWIGPATLQIIARGCRDSAPGPGGSAGHLGTA